MRSAVRSVFEMYRRVRGFLAARLSLDPAACVAVDDGPHHIDAFEQVGVFGILIDRWGSYRGDHLMVSDLDDVADIIEGWAAEP